MISGITSAQSALSGQKNGQSISIADFNSDELKDYQSALEYVNGTMQLNSEKVKEIAQAKADEQVAINNTNKALEQAKYLEKAIKELNAEIAKDPYNTDLIERRQELLELQRKSILAAEDEKQAMIDLVKDGIEAQLDSLKDLIDAYTDSLDSAKDLYDYQQDSSKDAVQAMSKLSSQFASISPGMDVDTAIISIVIEYSRK